MNNENFKIMPMTLQINKKHNEWTKLRIIIIVKYATSLTKFLK